MLLVYQKAKNLTMSIEIFARNKNLNDEGDNYEQ